MEEKITSGRNYATISPSAKSLLFMKGHTTIPFARQTAEIVSYPQKFEPDFSNRDLTFWARTFHFERRYESVNQLLAEINPVNILELSSGYSFRGLDKTLKSTCFYIDTDLPELIETKKEIAETLKINNHGIGKLHIVPLNALDEQQFSEVLSLFPEGEIVIVNEGLLMYLSDAEKEKLCRFIHSVLKERGGYWIIADIYLKTRQESLKLKFDKETTAFFKQHKIEENKFESFEAAKSFFENMGFEVVKVSDVKKSGLSSMKNLRRSLKFSDILRYRKVGKIQETWLLRVAKENKAG
jgi:O-methyltransferase involved in polyketide biosynthesis